MIMILIRDEILVDDRVVRPSDRCARDPCSVRGSDLVASPWAQKATVSLALDLGLKIAYALLVHHRCLLLLAMLISGRVNSLATAS